MIFDRLVIDEIRRRAQACRVLVVTGAHGSGKTLATRAAMTEHRWLDLDVAETRSAFAAAPLERLKAIDHATVIDHAENLPRLFDALSQYARSRDDTQPLVVVTSIDPGEMVGTPMAGVDGIAVIEVSGLAVDDIHPVKPSEGWRQLWLRGGAPEAYLGNFSRWHEQNALRIAEEIGTLERGLPDPAALLRLFRFLAGMQGQNLVMKRVAETTGLEKGVILRSIEALADRFVIRLMQRVDLAGHQIGLKAPVLYFRDTGMLHTLSGIRTEADLERHPLRQSSWESFVLGEAITTTALAGTDDPVIFFGDKGDGLVPLGGQVAPTSTPCFPRAGIANGRYLDACRARARSIGARSARIIDFSAMTWGRPRQITVDEEQPQFVVTF